MPPNSSPSAPCCDAGAPLTGLRGDPPVDFGAVSGGTRALVILGLSALAVTQPLLDLFGNNPEFFVAGNYSTSQIVLFAAGDRDRPAGPRHRPHGAGDGHQPPARPGRVHRRHRRPGDGVRPGTAAHARRRPARSSSPSWRVLIGAGIVVLVVRTKGVRLLVSYLAVANVFFLATFLFFSPSSELVAGASSGRRRRRRRAPAGRTGRAPRARRAAGGDDHARRRHA